MGKQKAKVYAPENLRLFAQTLEHIRKVNDGKDYRFRVNLDNLQKAIQTLPKEDRENIERYWGLTGGPNHSKKIIASKDIALNKMHSAAIASRKKLFKLDYVFIYDEYFQKAVIQLAKKVNKNGIQISDLDAIKYVLVFMVILQNGPKMCFETDALSVDTGCQDNFEYDEYSVTCTISSRFEVLPDNYIQLGLLISWLDMFNFIDTIAIKKQFGIPIPKGCLTEIVGQLGEIENISTFSQIRNFKERVFPCGDWNVTCALVFGGNEEEEDLEHFMKQLDALRKDWSKIQKFKVSKKKLQTPHELRELDVFNIGGLEFTDVYEVMFLYLERNLISSKN